MELELVAPGREGERHWPVAEGRCRLGRTAENDVVLDNATVSSHHAQLLRHGEHVEVEDLHSKNGTYVNGRRVLERTRIFPGDFVEVGAVRLHFERAGRPALAHRPEAPRVPSMELHTLTPVPAKASRLLEKLVDVGSFLVGRHAREEIYANVLAAVADLVDYQLGCLFLWDGAKLSEAGRKSRGALHRELAFSHTVLERAVRERTPLLISDNIDLSASMVREHIRSALAVPLVDKSRVIGVLYLDTRPPGPRIGLDDLRLVALLATTLALKISTCELEDELERARCVQQALLAHQPLVPPGYDLHAQLESCATVAGDLYDILALPHGRWGLVLGDVVGHGVSAALQMAALLATIRAKAARTSSPLQLVRDLHACAPSCLGERGFVTLFFGDLDPGTGQLRYVNAGQEGVGILHSDGEWERLPTTGVPVGMPLGAGCEEGRAEVPAGAMLAAWSDGFSEAHTTDGDEVLWFGTERVLSILRELRHHELQQAAAALFESARDFERGTPAGDDRTLLLIRRLGGEARTRGW